MYTGTVNLANKYGRRSDKFMNLAAIAMLTTATVSIDFLIQNKSADKNMPVNVAMYKQADSDLTAAVNAYYFTPLSDASKIELEKRIHALENKTENLRRGCQTYLTEVRDSNNTSMKRTYGSLFVGLTLLGLSSFYNRKKEALEIKS